MEILTYIISLYGSIIIIILIFRNGKETLAKRGEKQTWKINCFMAGPDSSEIEGQRRVGISQCSSIVPSLT